MFEVYEDGGAGRAETIRAVYAMNDGGRWTFGAHGKQFEFENTESYTAQKVRDRFTPEMLDSYLKALGIDMFSEEFFSTNENAFLVSKIGPKAKETREFTLEQVRSTF